MDENIKIQNPGNQWSSQRKKAMHTRQYMEQTKSIKCLPQENPASCFHSDAIPAPETIQFIA